MHHLLRCLGLIAAQGVRQVATARLVGVFELVIAAAVPHAGVARCLRVGVQVVATLKLREPGSRDLEEESTEALMLCSVPASTSAMTAQPCRLPVGTAGDLAARAPFIFLGRGPHSRLIKGAVGLFCCSLLTKRAAVPYTGRQRRLPRAPISWLFSIVWGPLTVAVMQSNSETTQLLMRAVDPQREQLQRQLLRMYMPQLRESHAALIKAGRARTAGTGTPLFGGVIGLLTPSANAVCVPGGIILVYSGLLEASGCDRGALNFVLAHEMGHAVASHSLETLARKLTCDCWIELAMGTAGLIMERLQAAHPPTRPEGQPPIANRPGRAWTLGCRGVEAGLQAACVMEGFKFSRLCEFEADGLALALAQDSGLGLWRTYWGAQKLFLLVLGGYGDEDSPDLRSFSTHPNNQERMRSLKSVWRQLSGPGLGGGKGVGAGAEALQVAQP